MLMQIKSRGRHIAWWKWRFCKPDLVAWLRDYPAPILNGVKGHVEIDTERMYDLATVID